MTERDIEHAPNAIPVRTQADLPCLLRSYEVYGAGTPWPTCFGPTTREDVAPCPAL